jgi:hypothetical protein
VSHFLGWDLSIHVRNAIKNNHCDASWLERLVGTFSLLVGLQLFLIYRGDYESEGGDYSCRLEQVEGYIMHGQSHRER